MSDRLLALSSPISRRSFFSAAAAIPLAARPLVAQTTLGKPLFVGEFAPIDDFAPDSPEARLHVPLAAAWVFDYAPQEADDNITATNRRAWQLPMLGAQNQKLARDSNQ